MNNSKYMNYICEHEKLKNYIYTSDISKLYKGVFIRYVNKKSGNINYGGVLLCINEFNNKKYLYIMNVNNKKKYTVSFENNIIFYLNGNNKLRNWLEQFIIPSQSCK